MKVLITGAAGSLGKQLVEKLLHQGSMDIYATDVKSNPFKSDDKLCYQAFDLRNKEFGQWVRSIRPHFVVHLASILQISKNMPREEAYKVDVVASKDLLESCVAVGVQKVIVTTSGAVYGYYPENKDVITEERHVRGNEDYFYSAHKAEVEGILAEFREKHPQLKQIVFRPGAILGPDFEGPILDLFQQKIITGLIGYPGPFNFIWSEDVVDYIIEGLEAETTGEFNIAGDGFMTMSQIAKKLKKTYLALPPLLVQAVLAIAKPLGLTQFGPEQVKFIKYRPVLANDKLKEHFRHQPRFTSEQVVDAFLSYEKAKITGEVNL